MLCEFKRTLIETVNTHQSTCEKQIRKKGFTILRLQILLCLIYVWL